MANITRRDFLNGVALLGAGATMGWPLKILAAGDLSWYYPPALTGMRGNHVGSFETAHALAWAGQREFGPIQGDVEYYDLVVIGAGISGLSAAWFYQQEKPNAGILILDNHDDFGGHAKRNEFEVDGHFLLSYGGTQSFDSPSSFSDESLQLLKALGIDFGKLADFYDRDFFGKHKLSLGIFYDEKTFGQTQLIKSGLPTARLQADYSKYFIPGIGIGPDFLSTLESIPLNSQQRKKIGEVFSILPKAKSYFKGDTGEERFFSKNYVQFLFEVYGIEDPALIALLSMSLVEDTALGGANVSLPDAVAGGLPGLPSKEFFAGFLDEEDNNEGENEGDEYVHHFPDGNATLVRILVQRLIPAVAQFSSPEQCLTAKFDYQALDRAYNPVRVRLNSLAVSAENKSGETEVTYLKDGKLYSARAPHTIMAGWHMMAAHIIKGLPVQQKRAMQDNVKIPLVYAQVALRQWKAIQSSGVGAAYCPGSWFQYVQPDFPVAMGDYKPNRSPDHPTVLTMIRMPCPMLGSGTPADLFRQGRYELLATTFETFEKNIREQLQAMYGPFGFAHQRDIAAITVNRWSHGFVYDGAEYKGKPAHITASQRVGNILIANADTSGRAYTDAAIDMAWQAIKLIKAPDKL